jgi:hypothetical protein
MTWQEDFAPDGALRDIVVADATRDDWLAVLSVIDDRYQPLSFIVGDSEFSHIDPERVFAAGESRQLLRFHVGAIELACHFFQETEIEFDFYPNAVTTEAQLAPLLAFVAEIGAATKKAAAVTPENIHDSPIFQYSPESGVVHYLAV